MAEPLYDMSDMYPKPDEPSHIFALDWGDTIGFALVDEYGSVVMMGSSLDIDVITSLFRGLVDTDKVVHFVYEDLQTGQPWKKYGYQVLALTEICHEKQISCRSVQPSIWKNSFAGKIKPKLSKHANDAARMALYVQYKLSE